MLSDTFSSSHLACLSTLLLVLGFKSSRSVTKGLHELVRQAAALYLHVRCTSHIFMCSWLRTLAHVNNGTCVVPGVGTGGIH
jgi:hypothetical protein